MEAKPESNVYKMMKPDSELSWYLYAVELEKDVCELEQENEALKAELEDLKKAVQSGS
mgnify:CR=1 FL=1